MRKIHYWPDGTWCEADELEAMLGWRSDDFGTVNVSDEADDDDDTIEGLVQILIGCGDGRIYEDISRRDNPELYGKAVAALDELCPEEKWMRMTNPQTYGDYGISLTEAELETFAEGREILAGARQAVSEALAFGQAAELGKTAAKTVEYARYGVLSVGVLSPTKEGK